MTLKEMNETVFKGKLSLIGLERMKESNVLPCLYDVPVEDTEASRRLLLQWKSTFVGHFVFKVLHSFKIYVSQKGFTKRVHKIKMGSQRVHKYSL